MTEQQKKEFIDWLYKLVESMAVIKNNRRINIEGLDEYSGICNSSFEIHLDDVSFGYAMECLNPKVETENLVINEEDYHYKFFYVNDIKCFILRKGWA